jgi:hypothetical protein
MQEEFIAPSDHPCNAPNISPEEFLRAIMRDFSFPITIRMRAAEALGSIWYKSPPPSTTLRIKPPLSYEYLDRYPWLKDLGQINTKSQ